MELDRLVHEPVRLRTLMLLASVEESEFGFILRALNLTSGNLSIQVRKLEDAGYVTMTKTFVGRVPKTIFRITDRGRQALDEYWQMLDRLRAEHGRSEGRP